MRHDETLYNDGHNPTKGPPAARSETPARELLEMCDQGNASMREKLERIVDGNANGVSWMNAYLDEYRSAGQQINCSPDDFTVDGPEMLRMMRVAIEHHPRYADLPYGATIMFAYIHHFPCP